MTLESMLENAFPGIQFSKGTKIDDPKHRCKLLVQLPLLVRLSREGTVALGNVFAHCIAIAGLELPGKPMLRTSILVFDSEGGVAAVECALQHKDVNSEGARRLEQIDSRLRTLGSVDALEALYRKTCAVKSSRGSLAEIARLRWEDATATSVQRAREGWIETMRSGRTALYLAVERKISAIPVQPADPIAPMQALLQKHSGGVLQVESTITRTKTHKALLASLDEPIRIIWVYRRMMGT